MMNDCEALLLSVKAGIELRTEVTVDTQWHARSGTYRVIAYKTFGRYTVSAETMYIGWYFRPQVLADLENLIIECASSIINACFNRVKKDDE